MKTALRFFALILLFVANAWSQQTTVLYEASNNVLKRPTAAQLISANGLIGSSTVDGYFADPSTNSSFSAGAWWNDLSAAGSGVPLLASGVVAFTGTSGTGNFARVSSPTFTGPVLGAATATSITGLSASSLALSGGSGGASLVIGTGVNAGAVLTPLGQGSLSSVMVESNNAQFPVFIHDATATTYGSWRLQFSNDTTGGDGSRPNRVWSWGYNQNGAGGNVVAGEPSFAWKTESYYYTGGNSFVESYWEYVNTGGTARRPIFVAINRATDSTDLNFRAALTRFYDNAGVAIGTLSNNAGSNTFATTNGSSWVDASGGALTINGANTLTFAAGNGAVSFSAGSSGSTLNLGAGTNAAITFTAKGTGNLSFQGGTGVLTSNLGLTLGISGLTSPIRLAASTSSPTYGLLTFNNMVGTGYQGIAGGGDSNLYYASPNGQHEFAQKIKVTDTTASTSTITGSGIFGGGIGVAGRTSTASLNAGGANGSTVDLIASNTATLDFGSIAAAESADLTITVTGASGGDSVHLGLPAGPTAGIVFNAFVSTANTVTVRAFNVTAGAIDPASASYRVTVMSF